MKDERKEQFVSGAWGLERVIYRGRGMGMEPWGSAERRQRQRKRR